MARCHQKIGRKKPTTQQGENPGARVEIFDAGAWGGKLLFLGPGCWCPIESSPKRRLVGEKREPG